MGEKMESEGDTPSEKTGMEDRRSRAEEELLRAIRERRNKS